MIKAVDQKNAIFAVNQSRYSETLTYLITCFAQYPKIPAGHGLQSTPLTTALTEHVLQPPSLFHFWSNCTVQTSGSRP